MAYKISTRFNASRQGGRSTTNRMRLQLEAAFWDGAEAERHALLDLTDSRASVAAKLEMVRSHATQRLSRRAWEQVQEIDDLRRQLVAAKQAPQGAQQGGRIQELESELRSKATQLE